MATMDLVESWQKRLRSRLYAQFASALTWQAWVDDVLAPQFQDLENAAQTILAILDIDNSVGVQLDVIGRLVGQVRLGVNDVTYRLYLKARVLANRSTGTVEEIFGVMRTLFGAATRPRYTGGYVKQFSIRLSGVVVTRAQALIASDFLKASKESAARGLLEWHESDDSVMFTFDGTATPAGLGFDVGYFAGAKQA